MTSPAQSSPATAEPRTGDPAGASGPIEPGSGMLVAANAAGAPRAEPVRPKGPEVVVEKHYRSFLKALSWRATGTLDTIFISFLITGKIKLAVSIGCVEVFTKIGLFYLHERVWNKISLGRSKAPEDYTI